VVVDVSSVALWQFLLVPLTGKKVMQYQIPVRERLGELCLPSKSFSVARRGSIYRDGEVKMLWSEAVDSFQK
jgi:hypothetical protein